MKIQKHILALALCLASGAHAQERTAAGALDTQMTWSALSSAVKAASDKASAVNSRVDQIVLCAGSGMIYAPGQPGADGNGCIKAASPIVIPTCPAGQVVTGNGTTFTCTVPVSPITLPTCDAGQILTSNGTKLVCAPPVPPSAMKITDVVTPFCARGGTHTVIAACPAGKHLLGCSGGPGDQDEKGESWRLMAEYKNERCVGTITKPMCDGTADQTVVQASCY